MNLEWVKIDDSNWGAAMPFGSCNAYSPEHDTPCGFPRRADGTCMAGHPAQPADPVYHDIVRGEVVRKELDA